MRLRKEPAIQLKSAEQIDRMYAAGQVVARTLEILREAVRPGISTAGLDAIAEREIRGAGAVPSFLGYFGYPGSVCTSVNEQVVHGIPAAGQVLRAGDVISIDCGAILDGWHGDSALTLGVGEIDPADQALLDACEASMWAGIARAVAGGRLGDISHAVEQSVRAAGEYGLIREYTGHGIGTEMHMDPVVRNYGPPGQGPQLRAGMALAIEPMITRGGRHVTELDDGWTVITADNSRAAHFEHTVAVTADGPWVLTAREEEKAGSSGHPERARLTLPRPAVSVADGGPDAG
ncbi:MAG TPA: type I methionyl aminopeptidase [Trebonia sp.]